MQCPYCNAEMKKGELLSSHNSLLWWQPLAESGFSKMRYTKLSIRKHGGILLCGWFGNKFKPVVSYQCNKCKKIIADYIS